MDTPYNDDDAFPEQSGLTGGIPSGRPTQSPSEPERDTRSSVVAARGTAEGLVLRIDGRVDRANQIGH